MDLNAIKVAVAEERKRCSHIAENAKPELSGKAGMEIQTMSVGDWIELIRAEIVKQITEGGNEGH